MKKHVCVKQSCNLPSDILRDGVLHLKSSIHLNEVIVAITVQQKLNCASVLIAHVSR